MYLVPFVILCCILANCSAWLPPERCAQSGHRKREASSGITAPLVTNISERAAAQLANLQTNYKGIKFNGIPLQPQCTPKACDDGATYFYDISLFRAYNCSFHTYDPRAINSVVCGVSSCKLARTVSMTDSYTASEGYNWGVKMNAKYSMFEKTFEVGGEVSVGGTYSCSYTKSRVTSDLVECNSNQVGVLQLYSVRSDMVCDFGTTKMKYAEDAWDIKDILTESEYHELGESMGPQVNCCGETGFLIDMDKISERILNKIIDKTGWFDPYTHVIQNFSAEDTFFLRKYVAVENEKRYRKIIPFTNENGDSVFEYACVLTK